MKIKGTLFLFHGMVNKKKIHVLFLKLLEIRTKTYIFKWTIPYIISWEFLAGLSLVNWSLFYKRFFSSSSMRQAKLSSKCTLGSKNFWWSNLIFKFLYSIKTGIIIDGNILKRKVNKYFGEEKWEYLFRYVVARLW